MKLKKLLFVTLLAALLVAMSLSVSAAEAFTPGSDAVYFVSNTAGADTNAGTSASAPLKTLNRANTLLRTAGGGTMVICGSVEITSAYAPSDIGGAVVYTSVWNGVDYRNTASAKLSVGANMAFANDTYFNNINLAITANSLAFSGRCHNFGFGSGVSVTNASGLSSFNYPVIIGGWNSPGTVAGSSLSNDYTVHVYSGTWYGIYGGHRRTTATNPVSNLPGDVSIIIKGGTFQNYVSATGMNVHSGRVYMEISGGTFKDAVIGIRRLGTMPTDASLKTTAEFTANLLIRISGGTFNGRFRLAESTISTTGVTYLPKGDATVVVTGGTFNSDFVGYGVAGSVLLKYKESVLSSDKISGFPVFKTGSQATSTAATEEARFFNMIGPKPDPYVIEKDGIYYYCFSSSVTVDGTAYAAIKVAAHGNVPFGELTTQNRTVFNASETTIANAKHDYWAPELHYFDSATVGSANAGWYIYFAADNGTNSNHRMYVLRATDPENPLSDYEMVGKISDSTNKWAIDGTVLQLNSKLYFVWSGWEGDSDGCQKLYIAQMSNPWTISSSRVCISTPSYSWETHDWPDVNEGPQVLQNDGATHIVFSASGSWDQYYCYGVLTLVDSNPLSASSWHKTSTAQFSSGNGLYGTGHGSFVKDATGQWWMIYHANNSLTVPSDSTWWAERNTYAQTFSFTKKTVCGISLSYPSFGTPAGHNATQYITVDTADYHASGDHQYSPYYTYVSGSVTEVARKCYICGAYDVKSVTFAKEPVFVLESTTDTVRLDWSKINGVGGYRIYRKAPGETDYTRLTEITSSSTVTYTDKSLANGAHYRYLMHAFYIDHAGNYQYIATGGQEIYTKLNAPTVTVEQIDNSRAVITVGAVSGATEYVISRSTDKLTWQTLATLSSGAYTDTDITAGATYYYKAVAKNANVTSAFSTVVSISGATLEFAYTPSTEGEIHTAIAERANGSEFTMLTATGTNDSTTVVVPLRSGDAPTAYIYSVTGEFITPIVEIELGTEDYYTLTLVNADADAIVFSSVPLVTYGDVNSDGEFTLIDVLRTLKKSAGSTSVSIDVAAADIFSDLVIDIKDVLATLKLTLN